MAKKESLKLNEQIMQSFENLDMRFGICKITECNASEAVSFTESTCTTAFLEDVDEIPTRTLYIPFAFLFENGVRLLEEIKKLDRIVPDSTRDHEIAALKRLNDFFKYKEKHDSDLKTVFDMKWLEEDNEEKSLTETDITVTIAEHLLGKLAPGEFYTLDKKMEGKSTCKCGCKVKPFFGPTGMGHEKVWHGFIDIIFSSHEGIPSIANTFAELGANKPEKRRKIEKGETGTDQESTGSSPPGGKCITDWQILRQAVAQTIVFSLVQHQKHPEFYNHMVPNIVISPEEVQIFIYDAAHDILLCSNQIPLFHFTQPLLLNETVIILWMVLHYPLFCSGFYGAESSVLDICKSNFRKHAADKWEIYCTSLKEGVSSFPVKPSVNSLLERYGKAFKFKRKREPY